nr:unnamed protein product [Naegleria fowleri]
MSTSKLTPPSSSSSSTVGTDSSSIPSFKDESFRQATVREYERVKLMRLFDLVDYHAGSGKGSKFVLREFNTNEDVTWKQLQQSSVAFSAKLLECGVQKGDIIATSLPFLKEHIYLIFACMRLGAVIAPLDLRLKEHEIAKCFEAIKPKMYFFLGNIPVSDFRPMVKNLMKQFKKDEDDTTDNSQRCVTHWIQFQKESDQIIDGAIGILDFVANVKKLYIMNMLKSVFGYGVSWYEQNVSPKDPCVIIFTTGSTGNPKAAKLSHENILIQNIGIKRAFFDTWADPDREDLIMMCNLPPSHVGCFTEQFFTTIYFGGVCVILHIFDAEKSLQAIEKYKVNALGQIPALFQLQWRLPNYSKYDLSSLKLAIYGGQAVTSQFLEKMQTMAPYISSGLGLTETAGFCTYTRIGASVQDIMASIGYDSPLCPISIREPPKQVNGIWVAGDEKPASQVGEVCFSGPQVFVGYHGADSNKEIEEIMKQTVMPKSIELKDSKNPFDFVLYTRDVGSYDELGLHFASRRKFIIKPKGYQVFPSEVEEFIESSFKDQILRVGVVGVEHEIFSEGIVAFVELKPEVTLTAKEILSACHEMAAYKRPSHIVFLKEPMPLNRVAKIDYIQLKTMAEQEVKTLRDQGKWDRQ